MPNHVENRVRMNGITKLPIFTEDEENRIFDFNKIIPMPETLNMEAGSLEERAIEVYLTKMGKGLEISKKGTFSITRYRNNLSDEEIEKVAKLSRKTLEEIAEIGKQYILNLVQYGCTTWYGWCVDNWDTKWNSYENGIIDENTITFQTAWSSPIKVIKKLSSLYPDKEILLEYADEDTGSNTGKIVFMNGEIVNENIPESCSDAAYEIYIELWGESACLEKDKLGHWAQKNCDECEGC